MAPDTISKLTKLTELSKGYKAFLYDCDGTLADNMAAHKETYIKVELNQGHTITGDIVDELAGWPVIDVVGEINKRFATDFDPAEFKELKYKLFLNDYIDLTKPIEFVTEHLKAHAGKVRIGVVSGSGREAVERTLQIIGVIHLVEVMICAGETEHGKPYPDPFLAAAKVLNVAPEHCLVFEDGDAGVESARRAGMRSIRTDKIE
ncbi:HAD family hydrolase [Mucilaginibacter auburnensis]|uniref:HAD superfamily hydrolase (TIGR01509 family) n=1 Tax=Mucilaginibacter auburnensis TaxID=1457233 RepID=A0A2H9VU31_9SPHI|nr:HAD family phosphatase [Mucilaginibacter auburnensis]PJJ84308.1 HAD superfamily hydrolase (TIGR01509 family) [Mucilaginibacter auburnensis]